jgi:hypothetical protein
MSSLHFFLLLGAVALAAGCAGGETPISPTDAAPDAGEVAKDAGLPTDSGPECVPATCAELGATCGSHPDGCGGSIECGPCDCTPETFQADCPPRSCETAVGCTDNACVYEPITCGGEACTCPGGACGDGPRACGAGTCTPLYCEPGRTISDGAVTYANRCVPLEELRCGTCGLGVASCSESSGFTCEDIPLFGLDPSLIECDGSAPNATFVFVDPAYTGTTAPSDGSMRAPHVDFETARLEAIQKNARAILIGGTHQLEGPLQITDGLSIYGGLRGWPAWRIDRTQSPTFLAPASAIQGPNLVGAFAEDIFTPTALVRVGVWTETLATELPPGASSIAILAHRAPGLVLEDVVAVAAAASDGTPGLDGVDGPPSGAAPGDGDDGYQFAEYCSFAQTIPQGGTPGEAGACSATGGGTGGTPDRLVENYIAGSPAEPNLDGSMGAAGGFAGAGVDGAPPTRVVANGTAGTPSAQFEGTVLVISGHGGAGDDGEDGKGGGGGSTGFTADSTPPGGGSPLCRIGGAGGGGGAGGCAGTGGTGGAPGGWTIGLALIDSAGLEVHGSTVAAGRPGAGGDGGGGGLGQPGQSGGLGGAGHSLATYLGSPGGAGSAGQNGGDGGKGADGQGRAIFCVNGSASVERSNLTSFFAVHPGFQATQGCEP